MFEIRGKFSTATVFADEVEPEVVSQLTRVVKALQKNMQGFRPAFQPLPNRQGGPENHWTLLD